MSKRYFSLLEKLPGKDTRWSIQFGSYIKADVEIERDDMRESHSFVKGTKYTIIATSGHQRMIDEAVAQLNNQ